MSTTSDCTTVRTLEYKLREVDVLAGEIFATSYGMSYAQAWMLALGQMQALWDFAAQWDAESERRARAQQVAA